MTLHEMRDELTAALVGSVGASEAKAMANIILEDVKGYTALDVALYGHRELLPETVERMRRIAARVADGEPLQYVLGKSLFRGRYFSVDGSTLIPRPETAQLVDMVVDDYGGRAGLRVMDIGTGSGCIAVSLALDLPFAEVEAIDVSAQALQVAQANAAALKARVKCLKADALSLEPQREAYDIIVSNPPYVMDKEKAEMEARVLAYEPATALFVPDADPLVFYKAIAQFAVESLAADGTLYFEINPLCATDLRKMLERAGFAEVDITRDFRGKYRFAKARK